MELLVVLFGITVLSIPVMLFRALVLCPIAVRRRGVKSGLHAYKFSVAFAIMLAIYEAGTLTGFSWQRMRYVSDKELIQTAIPFAYPGIYADINALRADYPDFAPDVRYRRSSSYGWRGALFDALLGFGNYEVKLPDVLVTLKLDGKARYTRDCAFDGCEIVAPAHPVFGIVGTVQMDAPAYEIVTDFRPDWADGTQNEVFQAGHCFSAYSQANPSAALILSSAAAKPLEIRPRFGFYLMATRLVPKTEVEWAKGTYSQKRITLQEFLKWKSCSAAAKAEWPDFAGSWWQR